MPFQYLQTLGRRHKFAVERMQFFQPFAVVLRSAYEALAFFFILAAQQLFRDWFDYDFILPYVSDFRLYF
jgi:hypothetical protein